MRWKQTALWRAAPVVLAAGCVGNIGDRDEGQLVPPGSDPTSTVSCPSVGTTPLRRLSQAEYANAVRDAVGVTFDASQLEGDEKVGAFASNSHAPVSLSTLYKYRDAAEEIAAAAVASPDVLGSCEPLGSEACLDEFVRVTGRRLLRGPLEDDEVARFLGVAAAADGEGVDGYRLVLEAMLQSPRFLYQLELTLPDAGDTVVALSAWELATRLSFFLWESTPDDALLDAASAGELATADGVRAQAERMLADPRARRAVESFHLQWLGLDKLQATEKDTAVYPAFDEELRAAMLVETRHFVSEVVLGGDGRLATLLTAPYSYLEGPLFDLYGVTAPAGHDPAEPVTLPESERAGLLTQGSFLATHAHRDESGPVQRGVVVQSNLLCLPPPPPPNDVPELPDGDETTTMRELLEQHQTPECAGCHRTIDGIGLGFEGYDGLGARRPDQNGAATDESGELFDIDVAGEFFGAVELAHRLSESADVRDCVAEQWFRYAFRRAIDESDVACSLEPSRQLFAESGGDVRKLLIALVQTDSFRHRAVP
jgi:hypothetical protein